MTSTTSPPHHLMPSYLHHHHHHHHPHHHYHYHHPVTPQFRPQSWWKKEEEDDARERTTKVNLLSNSLASRLRTSARQHGFFASQGASPFMSDGVHRVLTRGEEMRRRHVRSSSRKDATDTTLRPFVLKTSSGERLASSSSVCNLLDSKGTTRALSKSSGRQGVACAADALTVEGHFPGSAADRYVVSPALVEDEEEEEEEEEEGERGEAEPRSTLLQAVELFEDPQDRLASHTLQGDLQNEEVPDFQDRMLGPSPSPDVPHEEVRRCHCPRIRYGAVQKHAGGRGDATGHKDGVVNWAFHTARRTDTATCTPHRMWVKRTGKAPGTAETQPVIRQDDALLDITYEKPAAASRPKSSASVVSLSGLSGGPDGRRVRSLREPRAGQAKAGRVRKEVRVVWKDLQRDARRDSRRGDRRSDRHEDYSSSSWSCRQSRSAGTATGSEGPVRARRGMLTAALVNGQVPAIGVTWQLPSAKAPRPMAPFREDELRDLAVPPAAQHLAEIDC